MKAALRGALGPLGWALLLAALLGLGRGLFQAAGLGYLSQGALTLCLRCLAAGMGQLHEELDFRGNTADLVDDIGPGGDFIIGVDAALAWLHGPAGPGDISKPGDDGAHSATG